MIGFPVLSPLVDPTELRRSLTYSTARFHFWKGEMVEGNLWEEVGPVRDTPFTVLPFGFSSPSFLLDRIRAEASFWITFINPDFSSCRGEQGLKYWRSYNVFRAAAPEIFSNAGGCTKSIQLLLYESEGCYLEPPQLYSEKINESSVQQSDEVPHSARWGEPDYHHRSYFLLSRNVL